MMEPDEIKNREGERRLGPTLALSLTEAARELRLGRNKTLELIHGGQLRHLRVGRRIIIPRAALEEFLRGEGE